MESLSKKHLNFETHNVQKHKKNVKGRPKVPDDKKKTEVIKCTLAKGDYLKIRQLYDKKNTFGDLSFESFVRSIIIEHLHNN